MLELVGISSVDPLGIVRIRDLVVSAHVERQVTPIHALPFSTLHNVQSKPLRTGEKNKVSVYAGGGGGGGENTSAFQWIKASGFA